MARADTYRFFASSSVSNDLLARSASISVRVSSSSCGVGSAIEIGLVTPKRCAARLAAAAALVTASECGAAGSALASAVDDMFVGTKESGK